MEIGVERICSHNPEGINITTIQINRSNNDKVVFLTPQMFNKRHRFHQGRFTPAPQHVPAQVVRNLSI